MLSATPPLADLWQSLVPHRSHHHSIPLAAGASGGDVSVLCWVMGWSPLQLFHFHTFLTWSRFPNSAMSCLPLATYSSLSCSLFHRDGAIEFFDKSCLLSSIIPNSCGKSPHFLTGCLLFLTLSVHTGPGLLRVTCDSGITEKSFRNGARKGL